MVAIREWLDRLIVLSLCSLIFTLPFSKSAIEVCFIIVFVLWALRKVLFYERNVSEISLFKKIFASPNLPIYLFVLSGLISTCFSVSIVLSLKGFFFKLLEGVFLFFITADAINNRKKLNLLLIIWLLSIWLIGIDGIFQFMTKQDFIRHYIIYGSRIQASFSSPNGLGGWLVVALPLILSLGFMGKDFWHKGFIKVTMWILIFLLVFCLVMTYSRGAWIGAVFALVFFGYVRKSKLLVIAIPVLITLPIIMHSPIKKRLVTIMSFTEPVRNSLWREAMTIISNFPVFGCGLNTYSVVAPHYKGEGVLAGSYPHNSYLQMAAETGIFGLAVFLWLIFWLFTTSMRNIKEIEDTFYRNILTGLLAGLFGFLVHSFFDVNFYALQLANLMWFIMGLIIAVQKIALKEKSA